MVKPARVGIAQRVAKAEQPTQRVTPFNDNLRRDWATGAKSARQVLQDATDAGAQGASDLGGLQREKVSAKNAHRDLKRVMGWPKNAPPFKWLDVSREGEPARSHPVVCPIEHFEHLWTKDRRRFWQTLVGTVEDLEQLWHGLKGKPMYENIKGHVNPKGTTALGLHMDGAPTHKCEGLFTIAWNSLTGKGNTRLTRNIYTVVAKSDLDDGTLEALLEYLVWAMDALLLGRYPELDWRGRKYDKANQPIRCQFNAAMIQVRGDWEAYVQALGFQSAMEVNCCWACEAEANTGPLNCYNSGLDAGWRPTCRTHASFCAEWIAAGLRIPILLQMLSLCFEGVTVDVLHCVDQGMAAHIIANTFIEVSASWAPNQAERARLLQVRAQDWYAANPSTTSRLQGKLTWERLRTTGDWPKLKAKAAATRHLSKFSLMLAVEADDALPADATDEQKHHSRRRRAVNQLLVHFYDILSKHGRYFPSEVQTEIAHLARTLLKLYTQLAEEALIARQRLWKLTPKFHLFLHLCETQCQTWGNPVWYWTYMDEDLQKVMKQVALSCHQKHWAEEILYKWLVGQYE